jgi:pimeloyl-ACP methyl ester carboxylesterase
MRLFSRVYLFHGKGGSPNGTVLLLEGAFADLFPGAQCVRPELPHHDPDLPAEASLPLIEALPVPPTSLIIGVSLGGLVAAKLQETTRPDVHVICISSPIWADGVKLEHRPNNRVALYSSRDDVIAGRTSDWPSLAEAHDLPWLTHQTDAHIPRLRELVRAYVEQRSLSEVAAKLSASG